MENILAEYLPIISNAMGIVLVCCMAELNNRDASRWGLFAAVIPFSFIITVIVMCFLKPLPDDE